MIQNKAELKEKLNQKGEKESIIVKAYDDKSIIAEIKRSPIF